MADSAMDPNHICSSFLDAARSDHSKCVEKLLLRATRQQRGINEGELGKEEAEVVNHEMRHATDMKIGKLSYGDDFVQFNGVTYPRKTINGKDMIIVDGVAKEAGDSDFPWENDANNGNK